MYTSQMTKSINKYIAKYIAVFSGSGVARVRAFGISSQCCVELIPGRYQKADQVR